MEFTEFNEDRDMKIPDLEVGMIFSSAAVFRAALREHSILNVTDFKFIKNEEDKVTAKCKNDCIELVHDLLFYCSYMCCVVFPCKLLFHILKFLLSKNKNEIHVR